MRKILSTLLCATAFAAAADRRAPGFSLVDYRGVEHDLGDYRGKLVLLAFMQTTCPHCATFAESLQQAQEKYRDKVVVLAVVTPPDDPGKVGAFISGHKITYPILFDSGQMSYSYVLTQNLTFPRLYLIDGGGAIRAEHEYSPLTREIFEGNGLGPAIDRLLKGEPKK
jgi:cytochrome c biogenesis protein CcmG/thiol:disulfide interchange protein DsbE